MPDISYNEARKEVERLVAKLRQFQEADQIKRLGEEETKKNFITPLFRALGWDVENDKSLDEVINEEKVSKGRVDYSFRINGIPKFFLEAKALNKGLDEAKDASQAINYAWHKSTSWAVLTDFKTLIIYNAEVKEKSLSDARFRYLTFDQFVDNFQDLWLLSRQAFLEGSLDKQALNWGKKLRKTKVGDQLLSELMRYRVLLSKNILKNNAGKNLSEDEIDEAVQRIIDRLIFIRTTEDRNIEAPILRPKVREFEEKTRGKLTHALNEIYLQFDKTYNSKLFTFNPNDVTQRHLCETLEIDNEVLSQVIIGLYESKDGITHYDFSAIDADVLGNIYEQYLSNILKKTEKRAKVESKEAHRKEQGIYYTPTYIVDYIVRNTLGEVLKHKKLEEVDKLKVLDMACGSGSFLLKAFDTLDSYYREKEKDYAQTKLDVENETARMSRKTKILKNNIYGVDLDPKAVEIAQLNLLLKAAETKHRLPDLRENIKCGNSLIDNPAVAGERAFDWKKEFPGIMKNGGFDIIVGNPPYVSIKEISKTNKAFYSKHYKFAEKQFDLFSLFIERAYDLLKEGGYFGFIIPDAFASRSNYSNFRKFIIENCELRGLIQVAGVFADPSVSNIVMIFRKVKPPKTYRFTIIKAESLEQLMRNKARQLLASPKIWLTLSQTQFIFCTEKELEIIQKLNSFHLRLGNISDMWRGEELGKKSEIIKTNQTSVSGIPFVTGEEVSRYLITYSNRRISQSSVQKNKALYFHKKIVVRQLGERINAALDQKGEFITIQSVYNIISNRFDARYILGILNSKLLGFYYKSLYGSKMLFPRILLENLKELPIAGSAQKTQNRLVELVDQRLMLSQSLTKTKQTDERAKLEKEISELDRKIDELVYDLYGLTAEERRVVEEAVK